MRHSRRIFLLLGGFSSDFRFCYTLRQAFFKSSGDFFVFPQTPAVVSFISTRELALPPTRVAKNAEFLRFFAKNVAFYAGFVLTNPVVYDIIYLLKFILFGKIVVRL